MARIYISSTYSDLAEAREAVYGALRKMRHDVVAMEDYVSADQRPLDKCLADVGSCDVYVGIFAWRYGYVPPNQKRSITELEFRQARISQKPCLLFLLHEAAPWPRNLVDKDAERIEAFRAELCRDYLVSFFRNFDELAAAVAVAVGSLEQNAPASGQTPTLKDAELADLVSRLVNECVQLVGQHEKANQKLYGDFVEPALADFERLHQNYLETFLNYRRMLEGEAAPFDADHPVLRKINEDRLYSAQLRLKLEPLKESQKDEVFGKFITNIVQYTQGMETGKKVLVSGRLGLNAPRHFTITGLTEIFGKKIDEAQKKKEALALIDRMVDDLQWGYGLVVREHAKLKKRLLDSRPE